MKKIGKIVLIVIIVLVAFLVIYKVDSRNRTKDRILEHTTEFMNSVSGLNYERLKWYISDAEGNDLTDEEISNFLINSGLYRMQYLNNSANEKNYIYSTNVGFFNTNEGTVKIDVTALNGDVITNTFKYVNTGATEDFVLKSSDIQVPTKEKATYIMLTDLLNGESVKWNEEEKDTEKPTGKDTLDYIAFVKNSNGTISFEILKEVVPDYKLFLLNYINEEITNLKKDNENYNITWNTDFSEFNIYIDEEKLSSNESFFGYLPFSTALMMKLELYSMQLQILNNINDWHFKINYYDYNTNKLLSTENIR